ncbi:hypothetical protein H6796_01125 [Candidatus Nomurabacteria bacterium]|nr:hypothetical protein [Candidatus Nomurabacteria bacterium]
MNKKESKNSHLAIFFADRHSAMVASAIVGVAIFLVAYVSIAIDTSDVQIATRYTSFGEAQFYRSSWQYLIGFIFFLILYASSHVAIMSKLHSRGLRSLALSFGWLTIILFAVVFFVIHGVFGVAYLS